MKILIATGIFKPELGGPATFGLELAKRLKATGHEVTVVTYSDKIAYAFDKEFRFKLVRVVRGKNKLKNYLNYFLAVRREMAVCAITYTLDWFSAGLPVMLAGKFLKKKYIVRVGGGYIWEKYLMEGKKPVTLKEFYAQKLHKNYRLMFWIIRKVLQRAERVVFNSDEQRLLYIQEYGLHGDKVLTIYNAIPENRLSGLVNSFNSVDEYRDKEIVFAGRFIKMKNVESLIRAFALMKDQQFRLLLIGDGPLQENLKAVVKELKLEERVEFLLPMSQSDLYRRIAHSYVVVIPSWTDVSPHQAYECLALGIPLLLTKENYLSINSQQFLTIDPHSVQDIANKLNQIAEPDAYKKFTAELKAISFKQSWGNVVGEHIKLFVLVTKNQRP